MDAEQLDMLRGDDGKLPSNVFRLARGPGRPPQARNKRNDTLAKLICQQHGDPVLFLASIYSRPIDQMIELLLIADSTSEREERLIQLVDRCESMVRALVTRRDVTPEKFDKLTNLLDRVLDAALALKSKPGDLAIKALTVQKEAAKAVARYVHSEKPVENNVTVGFDATLLMVAPQLSGAAPVEQVMLNAQNAINEGLIDPRDLRIVDGEFEPFFENDEDGGGDE